MLSREAPGCFIRLGKFLIGNLYLVSKVCLARKGARGAESVASRIAGHKQFDTAGTKPLEE